MFPHFSFLFFSDAVVKVYLDSHRHVLDEYVDSRLSVLHGFVHDNIPIETVESWITAKQSEYQRQTLKLRSRGLGEIGQ